MCGQDVNGGGGGGGGDKPREAALASECQVPPAEQRLGIPPTTTAAADTKHASPSDVMALFSQAKDIYSQVTDRLSRAEAAEHRAKELLSLAKAAMTMLSEAEAVTKAAAMTMLSEAEAAKSEAEAIWDRAKELLSRAKATEDRAKATEDRTWEILKIGKEHYEFLEAEYAALAAAKQKQRLDCVTWQTVVWAAVMFTFIVVMVQWATVGI